MQQEGKKAVLKSGSPKMLNMAVASPKSIPAIKDHKLHHAKTTGELETKEDKD